MAKKTLECVQGYGRWNKGDVASFDKDQADKLTGGENAKWKVATKKGAQKPAAKTADTSAGAGQGGTGAAS